MLTLTQLILFGLLATCATGSVVEKPSAVQQLKWTPGSAGQPKWTLDVQLRYTAIGTLFSEVILPSFTFDVDGELINMIVRFWKTDTSNIDYKYLEVVSHAVPKEGGDPYFNTKGNITLRNHKGLKDIVKTYNCNFDGVRRCPYYTEQTRILKGIDVENDRVIRNSTNGWLKGGNVYLSITFDY